MPSLNLDLNYPDHPKTKRIVAMLGVVAEFLPVKLWLYVGRIHPDSGKLGDLSGLEIEGIVGWSGDAGAFISAMERVEWLKKDEKNCYQLLNWKEHQGHLIAFKKRGKIAAKARWDKEKRINALSIPKAILNGTSSNAPSVLTEPTVPTDVEGGTAAPHPVVETWNSRKELPAIRSLSVGRRSTLIRRLKDPAWRNDWPAAIARVADSNFCTGKNAQNWRADFDWFLKTDSLTKIMEGRYDNRSGGGATAEDHKGPW